MHEIKSFTDNYAFLSNFYPSPFIWNGFSFPTNEHFYQALKCKTFEQFWYIRRASTPGKAKRYGQKCNLREDWEDVKLDVMWLGLTLKFSQNQDLKSQLIGTGDAILIEGNTWGDRYWGQCEGIGNNHLGIMLMSLRRQLL